MPWLRRPRCDRVLFFGWTIEENSALRGPASTHRIGQESVVPNADQTAGKDMKEEALEELDCAERHRFFPVSMRPIFPTEADLVVPHRDETLVRQSDPMGVATQVLDDLFRSGHGGLRVNHPALAGGL